MHRSFVSSQLLTTLCVLPLAFTALLRPEIRVEYFALKPSSIPSPSPTMINASTTDIDMLEKRAFSPIKKMPHPGQSWDAHGSPMCVNNGKTPRDYQGPYIGAAASLLHAYRDDRMSVDQSSVYHGDRKFVCKQVGQGIQWGVGKGFPAICLVSRNLPKQFNYTYYDVLDAAERLVNVGVQACGAIAFNTGHTRDGMIAFRYTWETNCWRQRWFGQTDSTGWADPTIAKTQPRYDVLYRNENSKIALCSPDYKQHGNIPGQGDKPPPKEVFLSNQTLSDLNAQQLRHELEGKDRQGPDNNNTRALTTSDQGPLSKDQRETAPSSS